MVSFRTSDMEMNAHPLDLAGIDKARQFDHFLLRQAEQLAQLNTLDAKADVNLVKQAVAAGKRCQDRVTENMADSSCAWLNDAIYHSAHKGIGIACELIRTQIADIFPKGGDDISESPATTQSVPAAEVA